MKIGYARVSTTEQDTEMQTNGLHEAGCEKIFNDHAVSGTKSSRLELDKMLTQLRPGDEVIVWKLDRLGRRTRDLVAWLEDLVEDGIGFTSLEDGISLDPTGKGMANAMNMAFMTILSALSQLERDQLSERTKAGLEVARANGRVGGRQPIEAGSPMVQQVKRLHQDGYSNKEIQAFTGKSRATVYRYLNMADTNTGGA